TVEDISTWHLTDRLQSVRDGHFFAPARSCQKLRRRGEGLRCRRLSLTPLTRRLPMRRTPTLAVIAAALVILGTSFDRAPAADEAKVREAEPFNSATFFYTGTVNDQGKAYEKLVPAMKAAGLVPTGEEREMCLYWEGVESGNNVFFMQVGIK